MNRVIACWGPGRTDRGNSMVEFALAAPVVILLLMGIFEFGRLYYVRLTVQQAVHEAARFAVTGSTLPDPDTGDPLSRAESIKQVIQQQASTLDLDVDRLEIDPADGGGPSQIVTVTGSFRYQFVAPGIQSMFPDGAYDFTVTTSMKNEPFITN